MHTFRKPKFYGTCAGNNTGEDILDSPHGGSCNSCSEEGSHQVIQECSFPEASIVSYAAREKAEKKRKADKAYRERSKRKQLQMTEDLVTLGEENKNLKTENESLRQKNDCLTQKFHSQTKELNEHKNRLHNLKFENEKQKALLQVLSNLVVNPNLCHENQKLKDENAQLRENFKLSDESLKLAEKNGKLQLENMLLKVQIDALCGKIVDENNKKCGHNDWTG